MKFFKDSEIYLKNQMLLPKFRTERSKSFWNDVTNFGSKVTNSRRLDSTSDTLDFVKIVIVKYRGTSHNL